MIRELLKGLAYGVALWATAEILADDAPLEMRLWHYTYRGCQGIARWSGNAGIVAERRYFEAVERVR